MGAGERQLLYTVCCDEGLAQSMPSIRQRAAAILRVVDSGSHDIYSAARVVCDSMSMYCSFLLNATDAEQQVKLRVLHCDLCTVFPI